MGIDHLGPAVLGEKLFKEVQQKQKGGGDVFGPAVMGYEEKAEEEKPQFPSYLSVPAMRQALIAQPNLLDRYMAAEWEREGGPRKSALQTFLEYENKKKAPREQIVMRLLKALGK